MNFLKIIVIALVSLALAAIVVQLDIFRLLPTSSGQKLTAHLQTQSDHSLNFFQLGEQVFQFEVVNSPESITQGLSGREKIGSDGMLFIFSDPDLHGIWMLDMKFNLDIIWVSQGEVIGFELNAAKPAEKTKSLPIYQPSQPVDMVIEVPAGFVDQHNLKIGDKLTPVTEF